MDQKKQDSLKVIETKKKIKDAFLALYAKKKIEKIGIREITELAGVNRGTFYVYFLDIYDIRDQVESDFFDIMREKAGKIMDAVFTGQNFMADLPDTKFYLENKKYFDILVSENGNNELVEHIKEIVRPFFRKKLEEASFKSNEETDIVLEYMIGAHLSVMLYWLKSGMPVPLERIAGILKDISVIGPTKYLANISRF